ncbi:hypothetical protein [Kordia sp.]|uniref:hypothetical protein n=1 Tax=Kordia sp. TaxID=1965332 RepID=UPI003B591649
MIVKDFFTAVIKIFAVYILIEGIISLVTRLIYYSNKNQSPNTLIFTICIAIFFGIIFLMMSQADKIVSFLRLDKGFVAERFDFSVAQSHYIVEIALAIIGAYLAFRRIPMLIRNIYEFFMSYFNYGSLARMTYSSLTERVVINLIYFTVGIIIILLRKPIANLFIPNQNKR